MTLDEIAANVDYFAQKTGLSELVFAGGELTDRPDLPAILDVLAKVAGIERITVVSRGHRWTRPDLLERARKLPLTVVFSVDVWKPMDLSPKRSNSPFSRAMRSTAALADAGIRVATNTVLSRSMLALTPEVGDALAQLPVEHSTLTFPFPKGGALADEAYIVPTLRETRAALSVLARTFDEAARSWSLKGLPICYVPEHRAHMSSTKDRVYVSALHQFAEAQSYRKERMTMRQFDSCRGCAASGECDGFWEHYLNGEFPELKALA